jgi:hypothetical protein
MRRIFRIGPLAAKLAIVGAALAALGGVAYAATSSFVGPSGNINGCAPKSGGQLHIWKPGHGCSGGWAAVTFAASAAAGPAGATGATGASGPANPAATTVDGQTVVKLLSKLATPASATSTATLFSGSGLTILANCDSSGNASLTANGPASADSELTISGRDNTGAFGSQTSTLGASSLAALGPANAGETSFAYASSSGQTVTGTIGYQNATSFGSYAGCAFFGTAISG